jgi:pimeloyl-ACP methyl ester carboxylesterase
MIVCEQGRPFVAPAAQMAATIRQCTLAIIPDAGHSPQFENPDAWLDLVSGFLAGIPRSEPWQRDGP